MNHTNRLVIELTDLTEVCWHIPWAALEKVSLTLVPSPVLLQQTLPLRSETMQCDEQTYSRYINACIHRVCTSAFVLPVFCLLCFPVWDCETLKDKPKNTGKNLQLYCWDPKPPAPTTQRERQRKTEMSCAVTRSVYPSVILIYPPGCCLLCNRVWERRFCPKK